MQLEFFKITFEVIVPTTSYMTSYVQTESASPSSDAIPSLLTCIILNSARQHPECQCDSQPPGGDRSTRLEFNGTSLLA